MALLRVLPVFGDSLVLCHVRCHVDGAKIGDVIGGIVRLVLTGRDAVAGSLALTFSVISEARRSAVPLACVTMPDHRQPMPVLHGGMAHIAKLRLLPGRLAIKSAVWVANTRMGVVLALLAMEVRAVIIVPAAVLGTKALL
jgi:hypothetical protein